MGIKVATPGGAEIEFPDGTDAGTIQSVMAKASGGSAPTPKYDGWGDYAKDAARVAGQGAGLGFGDEIVAGVRSVLPDSLGGAPYADALEQERSGVKRFREHNPGTALGVELAAGFAVPAVGMARAVGAAPTLAQKTISGAKVGAGYGAVGGFGSGEGGVAKRLESSAEGAKWGAGIGAAIPLGMALARPVTQAADSTVQRATQTIRDDESGARQYVADRLREAGVTEADIARDLQRGQRARAFNSRSVADLPETIADTHPAMQRVVRGIKVGGDADDVIEGFLGNRQAGNIDLARSGSAGGQYARVSDQLRRGMNVTQSALRDDLDRMAMDMRASANTKFSDAYASGEGFDLNNVLLKYALHAREVTHPAQRAKLVEATRLFDPNGYLALDLIEEVPRQLARVDSRIARAEAAGRDVSELRIRRDQMAEDMQRRLQAKIASPGVEKRTNWGVNDVRRFQGAKEALDDMLGSQAVREQGNLYRLLTMMKHDLMDAVAGGSRSQPAKNAKYFDALQDYATRAELRDAADLGKAIANGTETLTPASWKAMSRPQQEIARKAYSEAIQKKLGGKAQGPMTDFTAELRKPNVQDDLRVMLPPAAGRSAEFPGGNRERLAELIEREQRTTDTVRKVMGNSTTAEKAVDAMDVGRLARVARYMKEQGGPVQAAVSALSDQLEKFGAVKGRRAQYLAKKLLSADPREQAEFLMQVRRTHGQARVARITQAVEQFTSDIERTVMTTGGRYMAEEEAGAR